MHVTSVGDQATSGEAGSCREAWEESLAKGPVPMVDQMKQSAGCGEFLLTLWAAELVRRDGSHKTMRDVGRIMFTDQLQAHLQGHRLAGQPREGAPDSHGVERSFIDRGRSGGSLITDHATTRPSGLAIRLAVVLHVAAGQFEQRLTGVAFIGEYESRGSR